ncbi:MAG: radical SAM protein [Thermodesulfovibrionales bacterium]|nr:radical SAM protein [Thermodesulfovibrionales bacterium]
MRVLLIVYDNDSYIHWFPQGLAYIAAVLRKNGIDVTVYNQDKHHYSDDHLKEYLDKNRFDIVGVSVIAGYYQYRKLLGISGAINGSKQRPFYIIGGHGPSPDPEFFMRKTGADAIVIGEGEITVLELLDAVSGKRPFSSVKGIAYNDGGKTAVNERRPLIKDIDTIPFPAFDLFPIDLYRLLRMPHTRNSDFVMPMLSGRGCTFRCTFCYRMDKGFRPRSNEAIIEEIKLLKRDYGITFIAFSDELLMSSVQRTESLCEDFIKAKLNIKWDCNGRLNYAKPGMLKVMKEAGCVFINYGIEAMDDIVLKNMKKALTTGQIIKGIEATLSAGISPGFNIIFGNIGDNTETLRKGVEFLLKYDDGAQLRHIRPVTPYPGSPLYYEAMDRGLLKDCEDFYENKHTNSDLLSINFTELSDDRFHEALFEANAVLIKNYFEKKSVSVVKQAEKLYLGKDASFRGFRQS